ncbi:hypothetical protein CIK05_01035 [Bdellovibrio sp. qaytius]|nr:hypothetical protein CIK05_01035 [Bdellovibrio sp. qaytius]
MSEVSEKIAEQLESESRSKLNSIIAVLVAVCASFMAIYGIKDNNIVQAMSQAQARGVDSWSYFQAKSTKQNMTENQVAQLELLLSINENAKDAVKQKITVQIQDAKARVQKYETEKNQIKEQAESYQKEYDDLNIHDDQFDLAEALISLGLAIFGITALTQKKPLFYFGAVLSAIGILFGLAGFLGWGIHPEWLTKILG